MTNYSGSIVINRSMSNKNEITCEHKVINKNIITVMMKYR
jgi:hypothetical protein